MKKKTASLRKKTNSGKVILGLVIAIASVAILLIILNILDSDDQSNADDTANTTNENDEMDNDYGELDNDYAESRRLLYIGNAEMYEIINDTSDEGFFVYVGRPTCPVCADFEPTLEETLQYLDQDLRYFQTDLASLANEESEMTTGEIASALDITGVPRILYIENGSVVDLITGNRSREDIISFFEDNGGLN